MTATTLNGVLTQLNAVEPHHVLQTNSGTPVATGGSTTTLVDAINLLDGYRGSLYEGGFVTLTGQDGTSRHRRIETDTPGTGTLTWSRVLGAAVQAGDGYLTWTLLDPRQVEGAVNRALERMRYVEQVDIAGVDQQRQYALATDCPWLTSADDILAVQIRTGTTALAYRWDDLPADYWSVSEDAGVYTLNLLGPTYASADSLRIEAWRPYATWTTNTGYLATGAATTPAPVQWLAAQTLVDLFGNMTRGEWGPEAGLLEKRLADAQAEARRWQDRQRTRRGRPLFSGRGPNWHAGNYAGAGVW